MAVVRTLEELERADERLLGYVAGVEGTMEGKTTALTELGVFRAYTEIHREYIHLAEAGDVEALKRAIFLQWFEVAEPPFLSGILDLDREAATRGMALVERLCAGGEIEDELAWMFPYYFLIAEWAFQGPMSARASSRTVRPTRRRVWCNLPK